MKIKRSSVKKLAKILLEQKPGYVDYGIYDQPIRTAFDDDEITVEPDVPISPGEQMSSQLSVQRPPIEDEDFVPSNTAELSAAANAIAQLVPASQSKFFYKNLHRLLDKAIEKNNTPDAPPGLNGDEGPVDPKNESLIRENYGDEAEYDEYRQAGMQIIDDEAFEEVSQQLAEPPEQDGATFEELADQFGFSGVPGVRQYIDRIVGRMRHFAANVDPSDVEMLKDTAVQDFIDLMLSAELIDEEDAVELQQAPGEVKNLDSFRFFFVSALIEPAFKKMSRMATKRVKQVMKTLGLPKTLEQTVLNQALGKTETDAGVIKKKLDAAAAKDGLSTEQKEVVANNIENSMPALKKLAVMDEDLTKMSLEVYGGMSQSQKAQLLQQAMQSTQDFQQQFGN